MERTLTEAHEMKEVFSEEMLARFLVKFALGVTEATQDPANAKECFAFIEIHEEVPMISGGIINALVECTALPQEGKPHKMGINKITIYDEIPDSVLDDMNFYKTMMKRDDVTTIHREGI